VANILPIERQTEVISASAEGMSIRSIERITGIHRDTIMRLGVRVGQKCATLLDQSMRGLECRHIEIDEIWAYVGKKQRNVSPLDAPEIGDAWTYVALDPDTRLVPSFIVGKQDPQHTALFTNDLASRLKNRVQLSSDGMKVLMQKMVSVVIPETSIMPFISSKEACPCCLSKLEIKIGHL
jgi:hypothetical protein